MELDGKVILGYWWEIGSTEEVGRGVEMEDWAAKLPGP